MQKKIFFLAGLQRSGATLLSSILNQNPKILTTPASPLFHMMHKTSEVTKFPENLDYSKDDSIEYCLANMPYNFYFNSQKNYVIDKNLNWATPNGLEVIVRYISKSPKIICCVRDVVEVLTSFNSIISSFQENEFNEIDKKVKNLTLPIDSMADRRANFLMRYDQDIHRCIEGMSAIYNSSYKDCLLFIEYNDLVSDTNSQIKKIYNFLNIENFEHDYENIIDTSGMSEDSVTGIKYLHKVRSNIEKKSIDPTSVLSNGTIKRYSNLEFWR